MFWTEHFRSANWNLIGGISLGAYLLGCFTAGYYLVRLRTGQDIRELGSGSVGARNVGRVLGRIGFLFTVLFDFGKGAFAVWAARHFTGDVHLLAFAMAAVVAGHLWPAQLGCRGGKGMATSLGALVVFDAGLALVFLCMFLALFALMRRVTLPALWSLSVLPLFAFFMDGDGLTVSLLSIVAGLVVLAHRKNFVEEVMHQARRFVDPNPDRPRL
jgi:glycerol-3-phosphate acyltransferase PlsY